MGLLIKGTVCAFLTVILFILVITGFFYSWIWWIEILLTLGMFFFAGMSVHFFRKDKQEDTEEQVRYSKD
jgi:c-di-AMP phosphodiesterase-like protein